MFILLFSSLFTVFLPLSGIFPLLFQSHSPLWAIKK